MNFFNWNIFTILHINQAMPNFNGDINYETSKKLLKILKGVKTVKQAKLAKPKIANLINDTTGKKIGIRKARKLFSTYIGCVFRFENYKPFNESKYVSLLKRMKSA